MGIGKGIGYGLAMTALLAPSLLAGTNRIEDRVSEQPFDYFCLVAEDDAPRNNDWYLGFFEGGQWPGIAYPFSEERTNQPNQTIRLPENLLRGDSVPELGGRLRQICPQSNFSVVVTGPRFGNQFSEAMREGLLPNHSIADGDMVYPFEDFSIIVGSMPPGQIFRMVVYPLRN